MSSNSDFTASKRLDFKMRLASVELHEARAKFWAREDIAALFPSLLFRMHCEARATIRLMQAAIEQLRPRLTVDPLAAPLMEYFEEHIPEELGHDDWVLHSLAALGFEADDVWQQIPPGTVASMVGAQYYWIFHKHPVALLGYIKVVESDPNTVEQIEAVMKRTGFPRAAFKFHLGHVNLEPRHNADLDELIDSLPLTAADEALIGISAMRTVRAVAETLQEAMALHDNGLNTRGTGAGRDASVELY